MSTAFSARNQIRIFRPETSLAGGMPFQPEWEPVANPYADHNGMLPLYRARYAIRLPRVPYRYQAAVTGTALTVALTAVVSLGMTVKMVGLTPDTGAFWLSAWQMAALIAVPARFVLAPLITKAIDPIIEPPVQR